MDDIPLEASAADVIEQRTEVVPQDGEPGFVPGVLSAGSAGWEADPADVAEQLAEVPLDDDWA